MKTKLILFASAVALMSFSKKDFAQAPTLGTAANFELFTSVGAITNTGVSQITGNVGSNSGSSTNFGNVNGGMHDGDAASIQCAADLTTAYNQLAATTATFFPAPLLGNGQILNAGVYSIAGAATLNLSLTLDGQGNPNAVFIFKIQGPFSAAALAKVHLINGALACNVFWKIEGLVSLASGTLMKGTIIANNAAISLGTGDTLEGRALSTTGAITIDGVLAYTPIGCGSPFLTGPALPTLASAGCYGIFTSDGPCTGDPVTHVTGDVGTNLGTTTLFNPLFVTGMIHGVPDGSTIACAADLGTAYSYLNLLPYDIELLYPAQFGRNLVLTPHTYIMKAAVTLTDTLILNGENNVNGVFVIQVLGAFANTVNSKIRLINGAQSKNIYWKIDGAVSLASNSIFEGTIVSNNGAISTSIGDTVYGRLLSTNGAINVISTVVYMPAGCSNAPFVVTEPSNQSTCSGGSVSFSVSATGSNLVYQWRKGNTNMVDGGNISGSQTAVLTINPATVADTSSFYNVLVTGAYSPVDTSIYVSLSVNSVPVITSQPSNQTICTGNTATFSIGVSGGGLTYQWRKGLVNLVNGGNISGATTSTLTINPAGVADAALNYNVIFSGACAPQDSSVKVSLSVNPAPSVNPVTGQTVCNNSSTSAINFGGTATTYSWTNSDASIGLALNGSGNIAPFNATDALSTAVTATITVTPSNGGGCNGPSTSFTITVNPSPTTNLVPNQSVCNNASSAAIIFSGSVIGTTYSWTNSDVSIGLGSSGTGTINSFTATNPGTSPVIANLTVTPSANSCTGVSSSFTITVNPTPTVNPISNQVVCNNTSTIPVNFTGAVTGTTYSWTNTDASIGLPATGSGNIASFNATNSGTTPVIATINTTPSANGCSGVASGFTITVNPSPQAVAGSNTPVCVGNSIDLTAQTEAGGTYSWTGPAAYTSTSQNPIITGATLLNAGTYTLLVTANGCNSTPAMTVVVVNNCPVTDLSIVKTVDNVYPHVGSNVVFTIKATNNGPSTATGVAVTDILQSGYQYVSSTTTAGTFNSSTGVWTIGNMLNGATETLTITVTVVSPGNYSNTAIIYGNETDNLMANNSSSTITYPSDFNIPEGFSPNGDGINDLFVIRGIDIYPSNSFQVFNRWGDLLFSASPYINTWDGTTSMGIQVGGNVLPVGTYFYTLDLGDGSKIYKGTIYLNK